MQTANGLVRRLASCIASSSHGRFNCREYRLCNEPKNKPVRHDASLKENVGRDVFGEGGRRSFQDSHFDVLKNPVNYEKDAQHI